ncbi:MAG: hypothetical protein A3J29_00790 [Acidobacteria bacterium RIFCSPLOWO2_12_FULL_67_14b]|nr:MAG: hypothetical protein A3J29_00790 [Acidobacteria bacterium RIFCSPLOWO2_12_FULL_67_14b]
MPAPAVDARWSARIARARWLARERPAARQALEFCADLTAFQQGLATRYPDAQSALDAFVGWLAHHAPSPLAEHANGLASSTGAWPRVLHAYLATPSRDAADPRDRFVVEALLQAFPIDPCPQCGGPPVVSTLREAGHGARRSTVCGLCLAESPASRLGCVACGESRVEALPVYRADDTDPARVDACDTCGVYLKTVDLTRDGSAEPIADDLASLPLDLWAREQGYRRLRANLLQL